MSIFSMDSKFMRTMSRIGDLMMLNFYFLITSVPIFTIGAALTALYTVNFRFGTDREEGTTRSYFAAFKENFKQATPMWLVILLCLTTALVNTGIFYLMRGGIRYLYLLFAFLAVLALFVLSYTFPLLSQFDNTNRQTMKNALILSIAYFPRSLAVSAINAFPFVLMAVNFYVFLQMGFLWAIFYFAIAAYLNTRLLKKVFSVYMPEEHDTQEEDLL